MATYHMTTSKKPSFPSFLLLKCTCIGGSIHAAKHCNFYIIDHGHSSTGMVVTSLNLLPCGRLEGGRIAQAMFGRNTATLLSFATSLLLGIGGLSGSVLCLAWGLFATFFRGGEEMPAKDEITPLGDNRFVWGVSSRSHLLPHSFPKRTLRGSLVWKVNIF